jgi:hypothetical protein
VFAQRSQTLSILVLVDLAAREAFGERVVGAVLYGTGGARGGAARAVRQRMARTTAVITSAQNATIPTVISIQPAHPQPLPSYHIIMIHPF